MEVKNSRTLRGIENFYNWDWKRGGFQLSWGFSVLGVSTPLHALKNFQDIFALISVTNPESFFLKEFLAFN